MGVKWKTTIDKLPQMTTTAEAIGTRKVKVGAFNGENAWLAGIHEYGCTITVTPKMRAFLHRQGLHLKDSTKVIKIPERSFLRTGHDENVDRIIAQTERALGQVLAGKMSVDDMLDLYGEQMATAIKKRIRDISNPPNHPYTVEQKGSSNPLVSTGGLVESISYKKE
jgi:phage gpG-like protein